jgi:uncharacterized membrane protein YfcA
MYQGLLDLHSYWAIGVLGLLFIAIINSFIGLSRKRPFTTQDRRIAMIALIFSHIQLVLGILLLLFNDKLDNAKALGMGGIMKSPALRLIFVEHPFVNIIALTLITIGWSKHKRTEEDTKKFKFIGVFYVIGLILLLSRIPWSQWLS